MTDEEIEHDELITQKIYEAEMNDDKKKADRLRELLTPIGPMPIIDIQKTLELIPIEDRQYFIDELDKDSYGKKYYLNALIVTSKRKHHMTLLKNVGIVVLIL